MCFSHIYKNIFKNKNIFSDIVRSNSQSENLRLQIAAVPAWSAPKNWSGTNTSQDIETGKIPLYFSRYIVLLSKNALATTKNNYKNNNFFSC